MPVSVVLFVAVVVVVLLAIAAQSAASPARIDGFVARYRLSLGDAGRAYVADHLVRTRRYRVAGVIGAFVVIAIVSAPAGSIRWDLDTVAAGWLLGAAAAESALARRSPGRRDERLVPRWLIAVPYLAGGVCLLAGIALYQVEAGHVVRWTFLALLVLGVTARAVMVAEDRGSPDDADARSADRAVRANSVATITAVGTAVAIAFEFRAGASVRPVDANDGGLGLIWLIGVVAILVMITRVAPWSMRPEGGRLHRPEVQLLAVTTVLAVATAGYFGTRWWHDRPPYQPSAVHAAVTVRFTDQEHADQDLSAYDAVGLQTVIGDAGDQMLIGRLTLRRPAAATAKDTYYVVLIDRGRGRDVKGIFTVDGNGWDGRLDVLPDRYPWLFALRPEDRGDGFEISPSAVIVAADQTSATFAAVIPDRSGITANDLLMAIILMGPDGQIYWAAPVPVTAA